MFDFGFRSQAKRPSSVATIISATLEQRSCLAGTDVTVTSGSESDIAGDAASWVRPSPVKAIRIPDYTEFQPL
jgi:hypothetical protein